MASIKIIPYEDCHKEQIIKLILDIQQGEFKVAVTLEDQPDLEKIPSIYQQGKGNFWVALADDNVIGTIGLIDIGHAQAALRKMFVSKEYRGSGVAQQLLATLFAWCKAKNIQEIYLGTVSVLVAAQRFYEKNGFSEIAATNLPTNFPRMMVDTKFYVYQM